MKKLPSTSVSSSITWTKINALFTSKDLYEQQIRYRNGQVYSEGEIRFYFY